MNGATASDSTQSLFLCLGNEKRTKEKSFYLFILNL